MPKFSQSSVVVLIAPSSVCTFVSVSYSFTELYSYICTIGLNTVEYLNLLFILLSHGSSPIAGCLSASETFGQVDVHSQVCGNG